MASAIGLLGFYPECKGQSISQHVIAASGNYAVNGNSSLSYTIGEPMIQTLYSAKNILTQGFQQPVDTLVLTQDSSKNSISSIESIFSINVYPNPFSNYLYIDLLEYPFYDNFTFELYNTLGQECITPLTVEYYGTKNKYKINTENLTMGVYILRVISSFNKTSKSILLNRTPF